MIVPDIVTGTRDDILASSRNIACRAGFYVGSDIPVVFKDSNRLLGKDRSGKEKKDAGGKKKNQEERPVPWPDG
jgi:hypothetical protein